MYEDVITHFDQDTRAGDPHTVAKASLNKGVRLAALGRPEEEFAAYDDVIARFNKNNDPAIREQVAKALFNKGVRLGALGCSTEALAAYRRCDRPVRHG